MGTKEVLDRKNCRSCPVGSCCYEGAEMTSTEMKKIVQMKPKVKKPWFRLVEEDEEPDGRNHFTTIMRNGTCVFQDSRNRCLIYSVRPKSCREFPLERGKTALYYERLCRVFSDEWPNNNVKRTYLSRQKKSEEKK